MGRLHGGLALASTVMDSSNQVAVTGIELAHDAISTVRHWLTDANQVLVRVNNKLAPVLRWSCAGAANSHMSHFILRAVCTRIAAASVNDPVSPSMERQTVKKNTQRAAFMALVTATVLMTSACSGILSGGSSNTAATGPIKIAMVVPLSGSSAPSGLTMKNGAQMAVDEINAKGGILGGRKLEMDVQDSACDPGQAVSAANKAVSNGDVISVGGYCSSATLPTLSIFNSKNIPMIIPAADSQDLPNAKLPNVFLINGTGVQQSAAAVAFMKKEGMKSVALVDDNTSYSKDITTETNKELNADGSVKVLVNTSVTAGEQDYSSVVNTIKTANPDMVYWTAYYQEGGLIINQLRTAGYTGKIMVADGSVDAALIKIAGSADAEGVFATSPPTPATLPGAKDWVANYTKKFNAAPGPYSTQSYDAVRLAAQAITNAKTTDGVKVINALKTIKGFKLFTGVLEFNSEQTLKSGGFVVLVVKNGKFVLKDSLQ